MTFFLAPVRVASPSMTGVRVVPMAFTLLPTSNLYFSVDWPPSDTPRAAVWLPGGLGNPPKVRRPATDALKCMDPGPQAALEQFEVLVVDDDPHIRELLTEFFRERGLTVSSTIDGRAAVAELDRSGGRYRLVLTDVLMPGADGFAVLEAARAANPSTYVVMITGYASLDNAITAVR